MRSPGAIWLGALIVFILDQATKLAAIEWLRPLGSVDMPGGFWALTYAENTGGAFSAMSGHNWIFVVVGVLILSVLGWMSKDASTAPRLQNWALSMLIGGAIGNLLDRVRLSAVVDFLDFKVWPIFNVADTFICIGIGLLLILGFKGDDESPAAYESDC